MPKNGDGDGQRRALGTGESGGGEEKFRSETLGGCCLGKLVDTEMIAVERVEGREFVREELCDNVVERVRVEE